MPYVSPVLASFTSGPPGAMLAHEFDAVNAARVELHRPSLWPDSNPLISERCNTSAQLGWNEQGIHALFRIDGPYRAARDDPKDKMTIANDSRVEIFINTPDNDRYFAYEVNSAGRALTLSGSMSTERDLDYSFVGHCQGTYSHDNPDKRASTPRGSMVIAQAAALSRPHSPIDQWRWLRLSIPWSDLRIDAESLPLDGLRIGLYRGEAFDADGKTDFVWTSWIDPLKPEVNFHTKQTFAHITMGTKLQTRPVSRDQSGAATPTLSRPPHSVSNIRL